MISKTIGYNGVHDIFRQTQILAVSSMALDENYWLAPKKMG